MSSTEGDFQQDFFCLFNLPIRFQVDLALLDQNYRALQAKVHPDKFSHLSETERRVSMQWATRVNEGYQILRKPIDRARYLLSLKGVETAEETNTAMPLDFLMQQMEWREGLEAAFKAKDVAALDGLSDQIKQEMKLLHAQLADAIDTAGNYVSAAELVRKLKFLEKLTEQISSMLDEIDG